MNDSTRQSYRRSSNEDEGVEEDFSSSGSAAESNPLNTNDKQDFEELTQMMKNSLTGFDSYSGQDHRRRSSVSVIAKTLC